MKDNQLGKKLCIACFMTALMTAPACAAPETQETANATPPVPLSRSSSADIDTADKKTENTQLDSFSGSQTVMFDADLKNSASDSFTVTGNVASDSSAVVNAINIYTDSEKTKETITLFTGGKSPNIDLSNYAQFTNNSKYTIVNTSTPGVLEITRQDISGSLNNAIADTSANRAYQAFGNTNLTGDAAMTTGQLTVYGNGNSLDLDSYGVTVSSGAHLTLDGWGSYDEQGNINSSVHGWGSTDAINNEGALNVNSTVFSDSTQIDGTVISNTGSANIKNTKFDGLTVGSGIVLNASGSSNTKISDSTFTNINTGDTSTGSLITTTGDANLLIQNTQFSNLTGRATKLTFGGNSNVSVIGSVFNDVSGGLSLSDSAQGQIYNTSFDNANALTASGDASLIFSDSSMTNPDGDVAPFLVEGNADVMITRSDISGSERKALNALNGNVVISDSKIHDNTYSGQGGAVFNRGSLTVYNSEFLNNRTSKADNADGGAIFNDGTVVVNNSYFVGNGSDSMNASDNGGAIETKSESSLTVNDSKFINNNSGTGGAIYASENALLSVSGSEFKNNTAINGGAVAASSGTTVEVTHSVFEGNESSGNGGAILSSTASSGSFAIENSKFINNTSAVYGGAISVNGTTTISADSGITEFSGNTANGESNAIHVASGTLNLTASKAGQINIEDKITAADISNNININSAVPTVNGKTSTGDGLVNIENTISNASVNLHGGTLQLGSYGNTLTNTYLDNVNLYLLGGDINMANGNADTLNLNNFVANNSSSAVIMDAILGETTPQYDKFSVAGDVSGTVYFDPVNIVSDLDATADNNGKATLQVVDAPDASSTQTLHVNGNTYTNDNNYYIAAPTGNAGELEIVKYNLDFENLYKNTAEQNKDYTAGTNILIREDLGAFTGDSMTLDGSGFGMTAQTDGTGGMTDVKGKVTLQNLGKFADGNIVTSVSGFDTFLSTSSSEAIELAVLNSVFSDNTGTNGAVFNLNSGRTDIYNSVFKDNSSTSNGGAIYNGANSDLYVTGSTFDGNSAVQGSAIYNNGGNVYVSDSEFNNNVSSGAAGILYVDGANSTGIITGSKFDNNTSASSGASLRLHNGAYGVINDSSFTNGLSEVGNSGAIDSNNSTSGDYESPRINVSGSVFESNKAGQDGGAIAVAGAYLNISDSTFNKNSAERYGGAIRSYGNSANIYGSTFNGNSAAYGGAFAFDPMVDGSTNNSTGNFLGSTFTNNTASQYGGAIYNTAIAQVIGSAFTGNTATTNGGAIYNTNNLTVTGSTFENNASHNRGAIYNEGGTVTVNKSEFNNNNAAVSGAGIQNNNGTLTVNSSTFSGNTNGSQGALASMSTEDDATVTTVVNNSTFTNNIGTSDAGGAVYSMATQGHSGNIADLTVNNSTFDGNSSRRGGALFANTGSGTADTNIINSTFTNNTATGNPADSSHGEGGAVLLHNKTQISNTTFDNNSAKVGGAAYFGVDTSVGSTRVTVTNGNFTNNTAEYAGGAIYNNFATTINNSNFEGNKTTSTTADGYSAVGGGAIYNGGNLTINASTFKDNVSATGIGSAIYNTSGGTLNVYGSEFIDGGIGNFGTANIYYSDFSEGDNSRGALSSYGDSTLNVIGSNFDNLLGTGIRIGSADYVGTTTVNINSSRFTNTRGNGNDNIFINRNVDSDVSIDGTIFSNGSNLYSAVNNGTNLTISDSIFDSNMTENGALLVDDENSTLAVTGTTFKNNSVNNGSGGALTNIIQTATTTVDNSKFTGNSSIVCGGAIYNTASMDIAGSQFTGNSVGSDTTLGYGGAILNSGTMNISHSQFDGNTAGDAGAILNQGDTSSLHISGSDFTNNVVTSTGSTSDDGGAIKINSGTLVVENTNFKGNKAQGDSSVNTGEGANGGALFVTNIANATVTNSVFKDNYALRQGGAIKNNGTFTGSGLSFSGNSSSGFGSAQVSGGAIINGGTMTLDSSAFFNNSLGEIGRGGAIANNGTLTVTNSIFSGNSTDGAHVAYVSSEGYGSALCNTGTLHLDNVLFKDNNNADSFGTLFNQRANAYLKDTVFLNNTSAQGAAIYSSRGSLLLENSIIRDNNTSSLSPVMISGHPDNHGTLNLIANQGVSVVEKGDDYALTLYASRNDAVLNVNLNAAAGGLLKLGRISSVYSPDNGVTSADLNINLNQSGATGYDGNALAGAGLIVFDGPIIGGNGGVADLNFYGGIAMFNDTNYSGANLNTLSGSFAAGNVLSFANGSVDEIRFNSVNVGATKGIILDVDMANQTGDRIVTNNGVTGDGHFVVSGINIISDGANSGSYNPGVPLSYSETKAYTNNYRYDINSSGRLVRQAAGTGGLVNAFGTSGAGIVSASFSLTGDYSFDTELTASSAASGYNLQIFGNKHGLTSGSDGHLVTAGYANVIMVSDVGEYDYDTDSVIKSWSINSGSGGRGIFENTGSDNYVILLDSVFADSSTTNGAVISQIGTNNVFITDNSVFVNNSATTDSGGVATIHGGLALISDSLFKDNSAVTTGGAIWALRNSSDVKLDITGTTFEGNTAGNMGGAIYSGTGNTAKITNSTFSNNSTTTAGENYGGGAIYNAGTMDITASTFTGNSVAVPSTVTGGNYTGGGAIFNDGGTMTIIGSEFVDNSITGFDGGTLSVGGGAIINKNGGELTVVGSTFENTNKNQQFARHGAYIYNAGENSVLNIIKSDFINGNAIAGGAVTSENGTTNIVDSLFENNASTASGGAFYANLKVDYTITGSDFINNTAAGSGGAINAVYGSVGDINATTFTGNSADGGGGAIHLQAANGSYNAADLTVSNSTFEDNHAVSIGGAIVASTGSTLKVYNSDFINNYIQGGTAGGTDGGAIYSSNGIVEVVNSYFENNRAGDGGNDSGGGIESHGADAKLTVTGSDFISNSADDGGAIINYAGSQLTVSGSNFQNNTVRDQGGAIANTSNADALSNATIKTSTFTGNSAANYGGAVYNTGIIDIQNSTFGGTGAGEGNSANYGGAVYIGTNATPTGSTHTATITNTDFINNSASVSGGAIYAGSNTVTNINGSRFEGNSSVEYGGAIFNAGNMTIDSTDFVNNTVQVNDSSNVHGDGGAIYNAQTGTLTIKNSTFDSNKSLAPGNSPSGSAIFSPGKVSISNSDFLNNYSDGVSNVYLYSQNDHVIDGSTFTNNHTQWNGGAIFAYDDLYGSGGSLTISNSIFMGNSAGGEANGSLGGAVVIGDMDSAITNSIFGGTGDGEGNTAGRRGGALYYSNDAGITSTHTIDASKFINNSAAEYGGAIFNDTDSDLTITNSVFEGNETTNNDAAGRDPNLVSFGGAIYNSGTLTIDNSSFSDNYAGRDGGAISGARGSSLTVTNSDFNNNSAGWSGGAIYTVSGSVDVSDSTFTGNKTGVYLSANSTGTIKDSLFDSNTASAVALYTVSNDGATIYNGTLDISNSVFKNNTADGTALNSGGAIRNQYGTLTVSDSLFDGNTASQYGAAVYNAGGNVTIKNSTFTNNDSDTSVIYNTDGGTLNLISEAGKSSVFSGNTSTGTRSSHGWGVLGNGSSTSDDLVNTTLTAEKGGSFVFSDNIASRLGAAITSNNNLTLTGAQGSLFSFKNNQAAAGGAIFARGNADINVDTIRFEGNKAVEVDPSISMAYGNNGGAIYYDNVVDGEFTLNANKAEFVNNSATNNGGAIHNSSTFSLTNGYFEGNSAGTYGGAIYNTGTMSITNSYFKDNTTGQYGGAIFNTGDMVVSNSTFIGNTSGSSFGGQVYNHGGNLTLINSVFDTQNISRAINLNTTNGGVTNIIADNGTSSFNGQISNNGTTNINAGNNGTVILGNYNSSASGNRVTNINNTGVKLADGVTDAPADGEVIFGGNVLDGIFNLYNGTMTVMDESRFHGGTNEAGTPYQLPSLNLYGGTLNLINDKIGRLNVEDFSSVADANLNIDADMTARSNGYGLSDSIYVHGTFADNSAISLNAINILNDGDAQHLTIFDNPSDSLVIDAGATYTNGGFKYTFTQNADDKGVVDIVKGEAQESTSLSTAGFVAAMNDTSDNRAFSATEDVDVNEILTKQGGTLTIFGNKHNFNGKEGSQLLVNSGTLNIYNVGEITDGQVTEDGFNGFANPGPGGVLQLDGVTNDVIANVYNSVFSGNSTTDLYSSGAIKVLGENALLNAYNSYFKDNKAHSQGAILVQYGTANIVSSVFDNNYAQTSGGALGNAYGTVTVVDTVFKNNTSGGDRGALVTGETATTAIYDSTFIGNSAANTGGAVGNAGDMSISYSTFGGENAGEGNSAGTTGGAIYNKGTIDIDHTTFTGNSAGTHGGAIYNDASADTGSAGATVNISDSEFTNNSASSGSAIYNNAGTVNVENSKFDSNKSTANAAVVNKNAGTMDIVNSQFTNNVNDGSATTDNSHATGGALYNSNENSVMNVIATNGGSTSFTGNSTATWGGAIDNDAGAELYLFADKGSKLSFENNTAETGGAIHNSSSSYTDFYGTKGSVISFVGNNATGNGGAIDTFGTTNSVTINGDTVEFKNNSAGSGGAIRNASVFTIAANNAIFSGNSANQGGAINNTSAGILNLITDNGLIEFKDNTAAGVSNDMYNAGTANLNTGAFGEIVFNGRINGNNTANGTININNSGTYTVTEMSLDDDGNLVKTQVEKDRPTGGEVTFNDLVTNQNINLYNGTLTLDSESNFNATDNLSLYGGTLNLVNNATGNMAIGNFTSQDGASIFFDANLATGASDSISANTVSGTLNIGAINILADGDADKLTLFTDEKSPVLNSLKTFTNNAVYEFTSSDVAGVIDVNKINNASYGLPEAVADTTPTRAFSATGDVDLNVDLGDMRGTNSTLTIFGNNHNINGNGHSGVGVAMGKTLNIYNVGSMNDDGTVKTSWNGFRDRVGSVVSVVDASLNIYDSVFSDNAMTANSTGQGTSGAIKLQDGAEANITNSYFVNNRNEVNSAGAIGMQDGVKAVINNTVFDSNYAAASGGALYVFGDDSQAGSDVDIIGSTFKNNTTDAYGGAIALNKEGSTADIESTSFNENIADINGGAISVNANNTLNVTDSIFNKNNAAQSGGAITTAGTTTITGSTFEGNTSDVVFATAADGGGAIYATGGTLNISGDTTFTSNKTNAAGGAINVAAGSATIRDTKFENNESALGGAINAYNDTVVNIYNSEFINNTSTDNSTGGDDGGAIYNLGTMLVDGSTFEGNGADDSDTNSSGGAIENGAHGTLTVNNSTFTGNTAYQAGAVMTNGGETDITGSTFTGNSAVAAGGAISTISGGTATVTGSTFTGNSAGTNGGAVHNSGGSTITITDSTFGGTTTDEDGNNTDANTAQNGGAIANDSASTVNISATDGNQTTFTSNKATNNGGAISNSGTLNINTPPVPGAKVVFDSNSAAASGGAIYTTGTANVNNAIFNNNSAITSGGAIFNDVDATLNISDSEFTNNSAERGSAIYNASGTITIENSRFDSNKSNDSASVHNDGGTINIVNSEFTNNVNNGDTGLAGALFNTNDSTLNISAIDGATTSFIGNSASQWGGAINNDKGASLYLHAGENSKLLFERNSAQNGGAIHNSDTADSNVHITADKGSLISFVGNSSSLVGGAIDNRNSIFEISADTLEFKNNTANGHGGAINNLGSMNISANNITFSGNSSIVNGGAINNQGTVNINTPSIEGAKIVFESNSANSGGAIYTTDTFNIGNAEFFNNTAKENGGAICIEYGESTISNSVFKGNKTTNTAPAGSDLSLKSYGGAISTGGPLTVDNSSFSDNWTGRDGGAIFASGELTVTDSDFTNNHSEWSGAALAVLNQLTVSNSTFENNSAVQYGGAIYNGGVATTNIAGSTFIGNTAVEMGNDIYNDGGVVNFIGADDSYINGGIAGRGRIGKADEGTLHLQGSNYYFTGTTTITGGKIAYTNSGDDSYLSGTTNIGDGATLEFNINEGQQENVRGNIRSVAQGNGTFVKNGAGAVNVTGTNAGFSGTTELNEGKITYNKTAEADSYFSGTTNVNTGATLEFNVAQGLSEGINGNIASTQAGSGAFVKTGDGTVTLDGDNSAFTGTTTVQDGTLQYNVDSADDRYFGGSTEIQQNGTLNVNTAIAGNFNTTLTGNGAFIKTGAQTLTLEGNNAGFTGSVDINEGTLSFSTGDGKSFFGSSSINITGSDALASALDYTFNEDSTFNKNVNLNGYAALNFDTNNVVTIANPIVSTGSGNSASFNGGTYIFNTDLSALAGDIDFSNTTVQIGSGVAEFGNDALSATASNTNFDLDNEKIETLTFDNITFAGDTNLSFDIDLGGRDDQANPTTGTDATSDRIVANTGSGNVTLDTIKIIQERIEHC